MKAEKIQIDSGKIYAISSNDVRAEISNTEFLHGFEINGYVIPLLKDGIYPSPSGLQMTVKDEDWIDRCKKRESCKCKDVCLEAYNDNGNTKVCTLSFAQEEEAKEKLVGKVFKTCNGKANNIGICDTCCHPIQTTSVYCGRLIETKSQEESTPKEQPDFESLLQHIIGSFEEAPVDFLGTGSSHTSADREHKKWIKTYTKEIQSVREYVQCLQERNAKMEEENKRLEIAELKSAARIKELEEENKLLFTQKELERARRESLQIQLKSKTQ